MSRSRFLVASGIAVTALGIVVPVLASPVFAASPSAASDELLSGPLLNSAKSTFLTSTTFGDTPVWRDNVAGKGTVSYPKPGKTGVVSIDGTCIPTATPDLGGYFGTIPVGDGSSCIKFTAERTSNNDFTFKVDLPGSPFDGHYLGDGDKGGVLDLTSTTPLVTFVTSEKPALTSEAEVQPSSKDVPVAGDTYRYTTRLTNAGDTPLNNIAVDDSRSLDWTCEADSLDENETTTCTTSEQTLSQDDVDAGSVTNSIGASAVSLGGLATKAEASAVDFSIEAKPSATLLTTSTLPNGFALGESIVYTSQVENTGNVTLRGLSVSNAAGENQTCDASTLARGEKATCTSQHVLTQADIDAGVVRDSFSATIQDAANAAVTVPAVEVSDTSAPRAEATLKVTSDARPNLHAGQKIQYSVAVVNSGSSTLTELTLHDQNGSELVCDVSRLSPGETASCTSTHVVTQGDLDAGSISFTASGSAMSAAGQAVELVEQKLTTTLDATPRGAIALTSTAGTTVKPGEEIHYTTTVRNTGDVTLTDLVLTETKGSGTSCDVTTLLPGKTATCTSGMKVAPDAAAGSVVANSVSAHATTPSGERMDLPRAEVSSNVEIAPVLAFTGSEGASATLIGGAIAVLTGLGLVLTGRKARGTRLR